MSKFKELKCTTNRYVYNRLYKLWLEDKGHIHCSLCGYNRGENDTRKLYGSPVNVRQLINKGKPAKDRYPNWKLVSKNRKQWMKKAMKKKVELSSYYGYWYSYKW